MKISRYRRIERDVFGQIQIMIFRHDKMSLVVIGMKLKKSRFSELNAIQFFVPDHLKDLIRGSD